MNNQNKLLLLLLFNQLNALNQGITNQGIPKGNPNAAHLGHCGISYCLAKIFSYKYNIPFYYDPFENSDIFTLHDTNLRLNKGQFSQIIGIEHENDLTANLHKDNVLFIAGLKPIIQSIQPEWILKLKDEFSLKDYAFLEKSTLPLPIDKITIAIHIRKGNGGIHYDGQQASAQLFDHDRSRVEYVTGRIKYFFDWADCVRSVDQQWCNKFPPEQFYIDQIIKIYNDTNQAPLFVEIFTDDINPVSLTERIEKAVNRSNIIFNYTDNRNYNLKNRTAQDLYSISRFDVLIRSESYFGRIAELIGNHKVSICPLTCRWEHNRLIMDRIFIAGSISDLIHKKSIT